MTVSQAVERADQARQSQAVQGAPAQVSVAQMVKHAITRQASAFAAVLPDHVDHERFSRLVVVAIKATPDLMACFQTDQGELSVLLAAMQAAALGLEPNTPTKECWLLPRKNYGRQECQLSIGYRGYLKLARRSGSVKEVVADVVREGDEFEWSRGLEGDVFRHKATGDEDAPMTHAYCIVRYLNGGSSFKVLTRKQIEKRRGLSASYNARNNSSSPWVVWPEEMWCKTAVLAQVPQMDLSPELSRAVESDEKPLALDADGMIDALATDDPVAIEAAPPEPDDEVEAGRNDSGEAASGDAPTSDVEPEAGVGPSDGEPSPESPDETPAPSIIDISRAATQAFPLADAPRGTKTATRDRLRHAMAHAVTGGRAVHADDLTPDERIRLASRLADVIDGRMTFTVDDDGVVFTMVGSGRETDVSWADFETVQEPSEPEQ